MSEGSKSAESGERRNNSSQGRESDTGRAGTTQQSKAPEAGERQEDDTVGGETDPRSAPGGSPTDPEGARSNGNGDADEESLAEQLETAKAEAADRKDRYLRAVAEAENIRRRADNDIGNARKFAIEGFASEILSVRDSLEIARELEIGEDDTGVVAKMKEGLDLTLKQLDSALSKFSIEPVDPVKGDKLDPDRHQAMSTQESDNVPPNHILSVVQNGYMIHGRLLRPAMVVVAKKPRDEAQAESETA